MLRWAISANSRAGSSTNGFVDQDARNRLHPVPSFCRERTPSRSVIPIERPFSIDLSSIPSWTITASLLCQESSSLAASSQSIAVARFSSLISIKSPQENVQTTHKKGQAASKPQSSMFVMEAPITTPQRDLDAILYPS